MKIIVFILFSILYGLSAENEILPDKIFIGTPITITSVINIDPKLSLVPEYKFLSKTNIEIDSIIVNNNRIIQNLRIWNLGSHKTPRIKILIIDEKENKLDSIFIESIEINVDSTIIYNNTILDNKPLLSLENINSRNNNLYALMFFISIVFFFIFYNKKSKLNNTKTIFKNYDKTNAVDDINKIKINFSSSIEIDQFYILISNIFKKYFSNKFFINANKMTSDEIIFFLKQKKINQNISLKLESILNSIDINKYSKNKSTNFQALEDKKNIIYIINIIEKI